MFWKLDLSSVRVRWQLAFAFIAWIALYMIVVQEVFALPLLQALIESVALSLLLLLSTFVASNTLKFYLPATEQVAFFIMISGLLSAGVVAIDYYVLRSLIHHYIPLEEHQGMIYLHSFTAFIVNTGALAISLQSKQLKEQAELEKRQSDTEKQAKEAELFKLRYQLQPHFLFNSLNSINALINVDPAQARKMIQQLSAFLRGTIKSEEAQVALKEEIEQMNLYLDIEKVRFGHRLSTELKLEEEASLCLLPALILQPLVENAIKFGLYGTVDDVCIRIVATKKDGNLHLSIVNPIDKDVQTQVGTGFGLNAIRRRLLLTYGRNDLLKTKEGEDTFEVELMIPQKA